MKSHSAEYVSPGHPDWLADAIVESIVDLAVGRDSKALVGVECAVHTDHVFIDGRIAAGKGKCAVSDDERAIRSLSDDQSVVTGFACNHPETDDSLGLTHPIPSSALPPEDWFSIDSIVADLRLTAIIRREKVLSGYFMQS